jgi:hypothetical protein
MIFGVAAIKASAHNQMLMHDDQTEHRVTAEESSYRPKQWRLATDPLDHPAYYSLPSVWSFAKHAKLDLLLTWLCRHESTEIDYKSYQHQPPDHSL